MGTPVVLGHETVQEILTNLSTEEVVAFQNELAESLVALHAHNEQEYQPHPTAISRPNGSKILFRPFTSEAVHGVKIIVDPTLPSAQGPEQNQETLTRDATKATTLHGVLLLLNQDGRLSGLVNADEITGFRTALSVMVPYSYRINTAHIVCIGAGTQALWHIRLALCLKGKDVKRITIVNRTIERARSLVGRLQEENQNRWNFPILFDVVGMNGNEQQNLEAALDDADVIFCTVPSSQPLFPAKCLRPRDEKHRGRFISGVASWQPDLIELDPQILNNAIHAASLHGTNLPAVIVDDKQEAFQISGDFLQGGFNLEQTAALAEVLSEMRKSTAASTQAQKWLSEGFVVYKSVGVSVTDLAVGSKLLSMAGKNGKGLPVPDF